MIIKRIRNKVLQVLRLKEELSFGKIIIDKSAYAAPDFMIIGAAKAGTTSLFQYLTQHPDILPPKEKELLYFSVRHAKGLKWYLKNFPKKEDKEGKLSFEGSPSYMYYPTGLHRIKYLFPQMQMIVILRDPVKRAFSQWNFNRPGSSFLKEVPNAVDHRSFKTAVKDELGGARKLPFLHQYIYRSRYALHLTNIYRYFDQSQVLVLDFEDLKNKPQTVLTEVTRFLGVDNVYENYRKSEERLVGLLQTKDKYNDRQLKTYNANNYKEKLDNETEQFLRDYFAPYDEKIVKLTRKRFSWMKH